jgi:hypothetical protein
LEADIRELTVIDFEGHLLIVAGVKGRSSEMDEVSKDKGLRLGSRALPIRDEQRVFSDRTVIRATVKINRWVDDLSAASVQMLMLMSNTNVVLYRHVV